ncbi:hypothetical protein D3C77_625660 [compost metagenome]
MAALCGAEKGRQQHAGHACKQQCQIPQHGFHTVIQGQCHDPGRLIAQALLAVLHLGLQRGVVQLQLVAPQRNGVGRVFGVPAQHLFEMLQFRRHDRPPRRR